MSSSIYIQTPDRAADMQRDLTANHGKPLAMPESPMPDWAARNRTPDPLVETPIAVKSAA